ncbi:MAG: hypothetical protein H6732_14520 [Alphaproteobacteria bacterium]|nr:hypothetical protein [Alphaproteobacteria bacterium]
MSTAAQVVRGVLVVYLLALSGQSAMGVVGLAQLGALVELWPWTLFWTARSALELTAAVALARRWRRAEQAVVLLLLASLAIHLATAWRNPLSLRENRMLLHLGSLAALRWLRRREATG